MQTGVLSRKVTLTSQTTWEIDQCGTECWAGPV